MFIWSVWGRAVCVDFYPCWRFTVCHFGVHRGVLWGLVVFHLGVGVSVKGGAAARIVSGFGCVRESGGPCQLARGGRACCQLTGLCSRGWRAWCVARRGVLCAPEVALVGVVPVGEVSE